MAKITQQSRLSHHTIAGVGASGLTFSVPSSEDFTDGSWSIYDLALSEIGVNEYDKRVYIRIDDEIKELQLAGSTQSGETLSQTLVNGNTTGGNDIVISNGDMIISYGDKTKLQVTDEYFSIKSNGILTQAEPNIFIQDILTTTNDSPTPIHSIEYLSFTNSVITIEAVVNGYSTITDYAYGAKLFAVYKNKGGVLSLVSTADISEKTEFSTATININDDGTYIDLNVVGEVGETIKWQVRLNYQISYK